MTLPQAAVLITLIGASAYVLTWVGMAIFGGTPSQRSPQADAVAEDLDAIRADLADIKESLAELDRMFKSVG